MVGGQSSQSGYLSSHHGLPINLSSEKFETATQATYSMASFDNPHRTDTELQLMDPPSSGTTMDSCKCGLHSSISMPQSSTLWAGSLYSPCFDSPLPTADYYDYPTPSSVVQDSGGYMDFVKVPRSCPQYNSSNTPSEGNFAMEGYGHSEYVMGSSKYPAPGVQGQTPLDYATQQSSYDLGRLNISPQQMEQDDVDWNGMSFYNVADDFGKDSSSGPSEDGASVRSSIDPDDLTADEPYAKLIYKALLSAPNHSMVLQDIYQWFRENTTKGSPDSKGWMNSIRHNLSMNAAFRKTERKLSGDDSKKCTEWVLEDFAIKGGVLSTTRYRSKLGAKKFMKTDNPAPARQSSGRKGGIIASKTRLHRQRAGRIDQMDTRPSSSRLQSIDPARRLELQQHVNARIMDGKARTPLTPPSAPTLPNGYYFGKSEPAYNMLPDSFYRLDNVSGIFTDDGPVFGIADVYGGTHVAEAGFLHRNQHF